MPVPDVPGPAKQPVRAEKTEGDGNPGRKRNTGQIPGAILQSREIGLHRSRRQTAVHVPDVRRLERVQPAVNLLLLKGERRH